MTAPPDLSLRARPKQARSQATVQRLLETAAELLAEVGVDGFNTNLLAKRAGVGVRAVYRYFPNKWSVLTALAEQLHELERSWIGDLRETGDGSDWREALQRTIDNYYQAARGRPGYVALRAASRASPELRALDQAANRVLQEEFAEGLALLGLPLESARLEVLSQVVIETSNRILDLALENDPARASLLIAELKRMLVNYLSDYEAMEPPGGP